MTSSGSTAGDRLLGKEGQHGVEHVCAQKRKGTGVNEFWKKKKGGTKGALLARQKKAPKRRHPCPWCKEEENGRETRGGKGNGL